MLSQTYGYIRDQMSAISGMNSSPQQQRFFEPSPVDVLVLKVMVQKAKGIPLEIVDTIVEFAEYWPCSHTSVDYRNPVTGHESKAFRQDANTMVLRTPPIGFRNPLTDRYSTDEKIPPGEIRNECELKHFEKYLGEAMPPLKNPVRKVVFTLKSRDQGWGGGPSHGMYEGSYTWFEAGVEKFDIDAQSTDRSTNPTTSSHIANSGRFSPAEHEWRRVQPGCRTVTHDAYHHLDLAGRRRERLPEAEDLTLFGRGAGTGDGNFVRNLEVGDVITVWAKSRFPGWVNNVYSVKVSVYWAV
ncbi:unnamed protein product [Parascedosporium putredinis]|uniref:Uncharacterized protein n=1 Tax=Parascedosporium putredinis TaxID=1442378 RepID=A0A9P1GVH8_9PEZI|nr:unnamed protein product [Parascedosporium putredinis]CAI7988475.1 unnamed protein product [Parascedosporium putredinis]